MQRLEFSGAVRPIYGSLGVKRLISITHIYKNTVELLDTLKFVYKITAFYGQILMYLITHPYFIHAVLFPHFIIYFILITAFNWSKYGM